MKIVYTAGPYDGDSYDKIESNIRVAELHAVVLWDKGFGVFCPHLNTCHFEVLSKAATNQYVEFDLVLLKACDIILMLPGWEASRGATQELRVAQGLGLKVYYNLKELIKSES